MKIHGLYEATLLWVSCVVSHDWTAESPDRRPLGALPEDSDIAGKSTEDWGGTRTLRGVERRGVLEDADYGVGRRPGRSMKGSEFVDEYIEGESEDSDRWRKTANWVEKVSSWAPSAGNNHERRELGRAKQNKRGTGVGQGWNRRVAKVRRKSASGRESGRGQERVNSRKLEGLQRTRRATEAVAATREKSFNKTVFGGVSRDKERQLNEIAAKDMTAALLEYVEVAEAGPGPSWATTRNCTMRLGQDIVSLLNPDEVFRDQTIKAIQTANTLNNVFRNPLEVPLHDRFFYALVEGLVQSDPLIYGAAIAFDPGQLPNPQRPLSPYVHRGPASGYLQVRNVTKESRGRYAVNGTEGYEWFWKQRKDFSTLLWAHRDVCAKFKVGDEAQSVADVPTAVSSVAEGLWGNFQFDCSAVRVWTITYSIPFFGCNAQKLLVFKGVLKVDIDLGHVDLDQCGQGHRPVLLLARHRCPSSTQCVPMSRPAFRRGSYRCQCLPGFYLPSESANSNRSFFHGWQMETLYVSRLLDGPDPPGWTQEGDECRHCSPGCATCVDGRPCTAEYDVIVRSIPLVIESLCISVDVVLLVVVVWMRKAKIRRACLWCLVEAAIAGNILIHSTVVVQYFEPTEVTCFLVPWLRELGFSVVYGALILRIYRVLTEFQSRKAHRIQMRDKDLFKYLSAIVVVVIGYMVAWTAVTYDNLSKTGSLLETGVTGPDHLQYIVCQSRWWDYAAETAELVFLSIGIYECYCARSAPSDYREVRFITWAIVNEAFVSIVFYIARHCLWMSIHPDYLYLMYFIRCQLTASGMLLFVLGPKVEIHGGVRSSRGDSMVQGLLSVMRLWYSYRPPTEDGSLRSRTYSSSVEGCQDSLRGLPAAPATPSEIVKLNNIVGSNGEVDVEEINLAEMNSEDIRNELKRLYTQLQIYKTKTMRQDNPHISKRRGGRKQTTRRFSFQPFHAKNKQHHAGGATIGGPAGATGSEHGTDMAEVSRTPEESSNSAEGASVYMDESSATDTRGTPAGPSTTGMSFKAGGRRGKFSS